MQGTVKFFNDSKGFGFINNDETGEDIFVHITGLLEGVEIRESDKVTYAEADGRKGLTAVDVDLVD